MRLDEAKLEGLRRWGQALRGTDSEESVAAGRAIQMLIEELERVRLELLRTREQLERVEAVANHEADTGAVDPIASTLHGRLRRALSRDSNQPLQAEPESVGEPDASVETDREATSARSWIESLRGHQ